MGDNNQLLNERNAALDEVQRMDIEMEKLKDLLNKTYAERDNARDMLRIANDDNELYRKLLNYIVDHDS